MLDEAGLLRGSVNELPELAELKSAVQAGKPAGATPKQQVSRIEKWRPELEALVEKGLQPKAAWRRTAQADHAIRFAVPTAIRLPVP